MMDWQPIETAPKDGTPILGYCDDHDTMAVVSWESLWGGAWRLVVCGDFADDDEWFPDQWAPISPPIKKETASHEMETWQVMDFWERVARGHIRLSPFEDRLVWRMRAAGETWDAIEQRINAIRQNRALVDASHAS